MNYRIETKEAFKLVVKKKKVSLKTEVTGAEISEFWQECNKNNTIDSLCKYIPKDNIFGNCIIGVSFGKDATDREFPYAIGAEYNGNPVAEKDLVVEEIPAHTYLVFECVGKMPEAFQKLYHEVYTEFLPTSDYIPIGGTDFEVYPSNNVSSKDFKCEFWISVTKK